MRIDNAELMPSPFLEDRASDTFVRSWVKLVRESYYPKGKNVGAQTMGRVLAVEKNSEVEPEGPRDYLNSISSVKSETCLKLWVHVPDTDGALSVPKNFLNPGDETDLIYQHFVYEAQDQKTDKIVPSPGEWVKVIHPWSQGFTNKVGTYLGKLAPGMAPTFEKTSNKFKNKNSRVKDVP